MKKTHGEPNIAPRHGVPPGDGDAALPAQQPARQADVADVGEPAGGQVGPDDPQLRRGPQHGRARQEQQPVRVAQLQGHEARVLVVFSCGGGRGGSGGLRRDEPVCVGEGAESPG